jgi:hypothetical protein
VNKTTQITNLSDHKKTIMNLTSYIGLFSVGPVGRATWTSFGAFTLKFTLVAACIGLKWNWRLSSVLNPVKNKFSIYSFFLVLTNGGPNPEISRLQNCFQNIRFSLNWIIFHVCTLPFSFFQYI